MAKLTNVDELAVLVSEVTADLCGITFLPCDPLARGESLNARIVIIGMEGERRIQIAMSCDSRGSRAMAAAMFHCQLAEATSARIEDATRELLNVVAAKVARKLNIESKPGLPRATTLAELAQIGGSGVADGVLLRSRGDIDIRLWIFEKLPESEAAVDASTSQPRFRSLVRQLIRR